MEFGSTEYQVVIWELFNLGRIGSSMVAIGSILAIWLSLRVALNVRNNPETNMFSKILASIFGLSVIAISWDLFIGLTRLQLLTILNRKVWKFLTPLRDLLSLLELLNQLPHLLP